MGSIKEFFPIGKQVRPRDGQSLLIAIVVYIVVAAVVGLANAVLGRIPLIGWLIGVLSWLIGLYCLVGIILAVVEYAK